MIKKLRKNIIILNVLFVGIIMLIICTVVCINSFNSSKENLIHGLNQVINQSEKHTDEPEPPDDIIGKKEFENKPSDMIGAGIGTYVLVETDSSGNIKKITNSHAVIDDTELEKIIDDVFKQNRSSGELFEYGLIYATSTSSETNKIAFADTSIIYHSLKKTILTSLALFTGGIAILFIISLGLSYLAVKPVEAAWEQQKQFVADASHELKTPLTVILANNNILLSHKNATIESEKKWLESTDAEAQHMKKLINQMLFLAKSDSEQNITQFATVNLSEITEGTILNFEPIAYENNVVINSKIQPDVFLNGDLTMLTQLAHILIDNAVKYAGTNGNVNISLTENSDSCILSVNNSGEILDKNELSHLFDRFYRVDKTRGKGGYGLGLSIADNIVKKHNGKISVDSNEKEGTTFNVKLSCKQ